MSAMSDAKPTVVLWFDVTDPRTLELKADRATGAQLVARAGARFESLKEWREFMESARYEVRT